jgi:hypothetical protein
MDFEKLIEESKEKDISTLKDEISQLMSEKKYSTNVFTTYTFNDLFRARRHNNLLGNIKNGALSKFVNEKEFWNSPIEFSEIGRCNEKWESLFYCASDIVTSILEVKPEVGDFVSIANFKNLYSNDKPRFIILPIGKKYLMEIETLDLLFENYKLDQSQYEIEAFLDELFHQNILKAEDEYKYKLSIAIAKNYMTDGTNVADEIIKFDGLIYPSIIRNQKSYCFVLKPCVVHCYFKISSIQTIQVIEKGNDFVKFKLVRNGKLVGDKLYPNDLFDIEWNDFSEKSDIEVLYY